MLALCKYVFISLDQIPSSGTVVSSDKFRLNFFRNCQTIFHFIFTLAIYDGPMFFTSLSKHAIVSPSNCIRLVGV